ncbi:phage baseplate assembly protein V [Pseudoxanthomonas sp. UTMC 1351]|uniref:phage baseplate assembly protein V n=1 Tax=Pseudoxanthomonas sp. UTMC 1351 TaxID=2695853 RepID=UPI0034CD5E60
MMPAVDISVGQPPQRLSTLRPSWISIEHRVNAVPVAEITLSTAGNALDISKCSEIALCQPGSPASISIKEADATDSAVMFSGVIVAQQLDLKKDSATLKLKLQHNIARLDSTCRSQVFSDISASEMIQRYFHEHGIPLQDRARMNTKQEQFIQFRCSDWLCIRQLIDEGGAWLIPEPGKVTIALPRLSNKADRTLEQNSVNALSSGESGDPIFEASWQFNNQHQPNALALTAWDIARQKTISARAKPETLGAQAMDPKDQRPLNDMPWVIGTSTSVTWETLETMANGALQRIQETAVQGKFKICGTNGYQLGQTLGVSGFGRNFDGRAIITAITHVFSKADWTTQLSTGMPRPLGSRTQWPRMDGLHVGVVADFKKDPNNLNRIRVSLSALGDSNNVIWARLSLPFASKDSGFSFYPEPGDEVVVGCFDADSDFPLVIGSMHNPMNKAPLPLTKENAVKGIIVTEKGKKMSLTFDKTANSAVLSTDKDKVQLKAGVTIESKSDAGVEIKADKIDLTS